MKKILVLAIALMAIGLTVVQAQTAAQQRELEQIARRSMNGLSPQDRQRVVQIMTDVYVAQGMSRQQAAQIAEMSADSMFMADVGEMDPEMAWQFQEQEERLRAYEEGQRQAARPQQSQQSQPGYNAGWPAAQLRGRWPAWGNLRQPAGTNASYNGEGNWAEVIYLTGANANVLQDLKRQIERITGKKMEGSGNRFSVYYRGSNIDGGSIIDIELSGTQITIRFLEDAA
jgi:hypothetical protein